MTAVPEAFYRKTKMVSIEYQLTQPLKAFSQDATRLWGSFITSQVSVNIGVTANPRAQIGDADVAVFQPAQGAVYFETYGQNDLYIIGLPVGTDVAISTCCKDPKAAYPVATSYRPATSTQTVCGAVTLAFSAGWAPLLAADLTRRRVTVKADSAVGSFIGNGVDAANFMPIAPLFPGYAVVEGTQAVSFVDVGTKPTHGWYIADIEAAAT